MKSEREVLSIIEKEEQNAIGYVYGELNQERADALDYYNREPRGDEVQGRSQVISSDVSDTVEWLIPAIIKVFASSDKAVEFEPQTPKDEQAAKQATDTVNYVFYRQNNGFLVLYSWFKDAFLEKNGYVKYWWETSQQKKKERYQGLTDEQMAILLQQEGLEIKVLAHTSYPYSPAPEFPPIPLHDVEIEITKEVGKICLGGVPPEELMVNRDHRDVGLQNARFVQHRRKTTASELIDMGYPKDKIDQITSGEEDPVEYSPAAVSRMHIDEEQFNDEVGDQANREIWVGDTWILLDKDEDGIAERRHIVKAGKIILEDEECEHVCIASLTPIVRPHRHIGKSVAELVMDIQDIKTSLWRQTLDNLGLTNAPRMAVLSDANDTPKANLDDLLTVRVGGIVREQVANAVRPLVVPYVGQYSLQQIEYLDQQRMNRSGVNNLSSGLDADALNKTARGAVLADNQMQQRTELIARIFAETGVKDLFKGILYMLTKYSTGPMTFRLRDQFVSYDPREWDHMMDMTVNVGLGTGNKDQQLMHLQTIMQIQQQMAMGGLMNRTVTEKNIFNSAAKLTENAGFKQIEDFFTDPEKAPPAPPPPPPPEIVKAQMDAEQKEKDREVQVVSEQAKFQLEQQKMANEAALAKYEAQLDAELEVFKAQLQVQSQEKLKLLEIGANQQMHEQDMERGIISDGMKNSSAERIAEGQRKDKIDEDGTAKAAAHLESVVNNLSEGMNNLAQVMSRPKKIIRGKDGRATGVE